MSKDNVFQRLEDWSRQHNALVRIDRNEDGDGVWRVRAWDYDVSVVAAGIGRGDTLATAVAAFFDDAKEAEVHPSFSEAAKDRREAAA